MNNCSLDFFISQKIERSLTIIFVDNLNRLSIYPHFRKISRVLRDPLCSDLAVLRL